MRLVFATPTDLADPQGGRAMLARLHRDALRALLGERLHEYRITGSAGLLASLSGQIDGASPAQAAAIVAAIDAHEATALWLDGSNLGYIAEAVHRARPQVRIFTFFHNVEARFFWGSLRARRSVRSAAVLAANYVAERKAVRHGDVLVTLSARDSDGLCRLYGRGADAVAPMMLADTAPAVPPAVAPLAATGRPYAVFVGGGFYANIDGIRWFARHVAPRIGLHVKVVGRGMEVLAAEFAGMDTVTLVGAVDDLSQCYADATLAIAPIFDGSGMKTKVAEALMFGKPIVGTSEAFSGYADDVVAANHRCDDADGFVAAIGRVMTSPPPGHDPALRGLYERDHSPQAARARLAGILALEDSTASSEQTLF